jgi:hypothetical protein
LPRLHHNVIDRVEPGTFAGVDVLSGFAPVKEPRVVAVDCLINIVDAGIATTTDTSRCDLHEATLQQAQPRGAGGWGGLHLEMRMFFQLGLHQRYRVGVAARSVSCRNGDVCVARQLPLRLAVRALSFTSSAIGQAKVKVYVGASHATLISRLSGSGKSVSGREH